MRTGMEAQERRVFVEVPDRRRGQFDVADAAGEGREHLVDEGLGVGVPGLAQPPQRTRAETLVRTARDCLVKGYESLVDALDLPDPDDRHVLAATIKAVPVTIARAGLHGQAVERERGRRE